MIRTDWRNYCLSVVNSARKARCYPVRFDFGDHDGVCSYPGMGSNSYRPEDLGTGAYVDVASNFGHATCVATAERHLMEDQAVNANPCAGVDDNAVWMGN
jgi:hypothetical protein